MRDNIHKPVTIGYCGRGSPKDKRAPEGLPALSVRDRENPCNRYGDYGIGKNRSPDCYAQHESTNRSQPEKKGDAELEWFLFFAV